MIITKIKWLNHKIKPERIESATKKQTRPMGTIQTLSLELNIWTTSLFKLLQYVSWQCERINGKILNCTHAFLFLQHPKFSNKLVVIKTSPLSNPLQSISSYSKKLSLLHQVTNSDPTMKLKVCHSRDLNHSFTGNSQRATNWWPPRSIIAILISKLNARLDLTHKRSQTSPKMASL